MTFDEYIQPTMVDLIAELELRAYRRERCFHHHFIACLSRRLNLRLGNRNKLLKPEAKTAGHYTWTGINPKRGNIDFVLCETPIELNYAYNGIEKISIDFRKLLDDRNGFACATYLAFGHRSAFRHVVERGYQDSLAFLMKSHRAVCLSHRLDVIVVEDCRTLRGRGSLSPWEANVRLLDKGILDWHPLLQTGGLAVAKKAAASDR